jgi:hypothetical protein
MRKGRGHKLAAASVATLIAEPALALAHTGGTGVIVGLAAGAVAYLVADEVQQARQNAVEAGEYSPAPASPAKREDKKPSLAYRLLNGKSVRGTSEKQEPGGEIILSPDLRLRRSDIIGKSVFVVGQRRSGKTTLGARLAEQIGLYNIPLFIPDSEGDMLSIYDLLPRGVIAAAPGSQWEEVEDLNLWTVTPEDADVLGFQILYEGMQVILDMASFENESEAWSIVCGVIDGLFEFANQYPHQRCPVEVFLDEAQKYLPEDLNASAIQNPDVRKRLLKAYRNVSGTGGKRGITPIILSQRFAETNNQIIAQSEVRIILRQTQDNDLARCMKYVRAETATAQQIARFQRGQGVYIGDDGTQLVTTFYPRESDGERSGTPDVEAVERFAGQPLRLQPPAMAPASRSEQQSEVPPLRVVPKPTPRKATLADAVEVWNASEERIGRPRLQKLLQARGLECSDYLAGELLAQLQNLEAVGGADDVAVGGE